MTKTELIALMTKHGDACITYRSENSNKIKYNMCCIDFNNKYIKTKSNRAKESEDTLLLWCWDTDSYRLIKPENVTSVVPLSAILKND